jgi:serine protease Do
MGVRTALNTAFNYAVELEDDVPMGHTEHSERLDTQENMTSHTKPKEGLFSSRLPLLASLVAVLVSTATLLSVHPEWFVEIAPTSTQPDAGLRLTSTDPTIAHPLMGTGQGDNRIADVAESVAPSVVNIDTQKSAPASMMGVSPFGDPVFDYFFGFPASPRGGFRGAPDNLRTPPVLRGNGSGVIMSEDGLVLTNNHVIKGADDITVTLNDQRKFKATVVGRDPMTDIAVLRLNNAKNLKPAKFGDSSHLRPGEWVLAIGSPLGFDHTVTVGIVSAMARQVPDINSNVEFIQTDAAINPGNSGGPLVNLRGEVIGINTAIAGSGQNIGFAIPVNTVKRISQDLAAGGKVTRPWIGVSMVALTPNLSKSLGVSETTKGVIVSQVYPDSPAYRAGFQQGDIIQRIDGKPVVNPKDVQETIRAKPIKSQLNLQILRNGNLQAIALTTEVLPNTEE